MGDALRVPIEGYAVVLEKADGVAPAHHATVTCAVGLLRRTAGDLARRRRALRRAGS